MRNWSLRGAALLVALMMLFVCVPAASAADTITASAVYDTSTMQITVKGTDAAAKGTYISLLAVHEDVDVNSLTDTSVGEYAAAYLQGLCDADGNFQFTFSIRPELPKGRYIAYLADGLGNSGQTSFPFAAAEDTAAALEGINQKIIEKDIAGVRQLLEQYENDLLLDFTEYSALDDGKDDVSSLLIEQAPAGGYADISAFGTAYQKSVATVAVNFADAADILALLEKYAQPLGVDLSLYHSLNQNAKQWAIEVMASNTYHMPDDVASGYREACICGLVSKPDNYKEIMTAIMTTYKDDIGIDVENNSRYRSLTDKEAVFRTMLNNDYNSYNDIVTACLAAINEEYGKLINNGSGGGSGSSGGSGGSGGSGSGGNMNYVGTISGNSTPSKPEIPSVTNGFSDMDQAPWAEDAVNRLADREIVNGYEDGTFHPSDSVTRAEFTKMIVVALGMYDPDATVLIFLMFLPVTGHIHMWQAVRPMALSRGCQTAVLAWNKKSAGRIWRLLLTGPCRQLVYSLPVQVMLNLRM